MRLDDLEMGNYGDLSATFGVVSGQAIPTLYHVTVGNGVEEFQLTIPHQQTLNAGAGSHRHRPDRCLLRGLGGGSRHRAAVRGQR